MQSSMLCVVTRALETDGGGEQKYLLLTPSAWLVLGVVATLATIAMTAIGVGIARRGARKC